MSSDIRPYKIAVPDAAVELLQKKLSLATFPAETDFSDDPNYGAGLTDIKRLVHSWRETYSWRDAEAKLNKLPQFTTCVSIEGHEDELELHFVHQKSTAPDSIPLLFCHGWPGSFIEIAKILPLLTSDSGSGPTFHVVAPSLPNYGFSQRTQKRGFKLPQYAEACHKLMLKLGYNKYATQGGDLGFPVARALAVQYPEHILASHMNMIIAMEPPNASKDYTPGELAGLARSQDFRTNGSGYSSIHCTVPHTPGFALADSPVGLLAWIYEKLRDWTDSYPWTDEEVLTWVSIYVFSRAGPDATLRIYYEMSHKEGVRNRDDTVMGPYLAPNKTPLGISFFPKDVIVPPLSWAEALGPVVFHRRHTEGGHFAAYERPELLVEDVKEMFGKMDRSAW
jgi:pimeloyl-ACP methyl ester carboxylesterase